MSIYRSAVEHPVTTALIFIALAILGVFSLSQTSIAQFPEFDSNTIMVMSSYPGANAQDIETNLTKVLENALNGVEDLKELNSQSKENISLLTLTFNYGVDIEEATNNVRDKLDMVNSVLPDGASLPVIFKFSASDMPIMMLSATADESILGLEKILDDKVTTPLARVSGVGTVSVSGAPSREIQVYCDPNRLQAYGLSISTIASIVAAENRNLPSGNIDIGSETYSLRVQKEFSDPSELKDIVVGAANGRAVYLRDVATVVDGQQEREQESYTNGRRSARIVIQKQSGANTVNVIRGIKKQMAQIEKTLPSDIEITVINDGSREIINTIHTLIETILITFLVVMFVVFYFVGIRPQKKQEKAQKEMRDSLQVGDDVTTIEGIIGTVTSIKEETCVIETAYDRTRIRILKNAVSRVNAKPDDTDSEQSAGQTDGENRPDADTEGRKNKKRKNK